MVNRIMMVVRATQLYIYQLLRLLSILRQDNFLQSPILHINKIHSHQLQ